MPNEILEGVFVNLFRFSIIHRNKLFCTIFLLLLSLITVYMPHGFGETYEHHDHEILFKKIINDNKPVTGIKKLLKRFRSLVIKLFKLPQILSNMVLLAIIRLVLLDMRFMRFSKVSILHLFSFLCFYFHGSKYKHSMNHSDHRSAFCCA